MQNKVSPHNNHVIVMSKACDTGWGEKIVWTTCKLNVRSVLGAYYLYCNFALAILHLSEFLLSSRHAFLNHKIDTLNCILGNSINLL